MADLTDEEIDALVRDEKLSAETAAKMKSGAQPKPTGGNYAPEHVIAAAEGASVAAPTTAFNSPFQKAMAAAANKAAEDAVAKYHAATRAPAPAAPSPMTPSPDLVPLGKTYDVAHPRGIDNPGGLTRPVDAMGMAMDAKVNGGVLPTSSKTAEEMATGNVGKPAPKSPAVAANLIDPALLDALHTSGELSPETAAKLHEMNGTTSNVAMAEKKKEEKAK